MKKYILICLFLAWGHSASAQELSLKYISISNATLGVGFDEYRPALRQRMDMDGDNKPEVVIRNLDESGNIIGIDVFDTETWETELAISQEQLSELAGFGGIRFLGFIDLDGNGTKEMMLLKRAEDTSSGTPAFADTLLGVAFSPGSPEGTSLIKVLPERAAGKRITEIRQLSSFTMADLDGDGLLDLLLADDENGIVEVWGATTATEVANEELIAANLSRLFQNYPNPFQGQTTIQYELSQNDQVSIKIYDTLGRQVRHLVDRAHTPGTHNVQWDGKDDGGAPLAAGIYFYQLQAGEYTAAKQMILFK